MKTSTRIATVASVGLMLAIASPALAHGAHHTRCAATHARHHHLSRCHKASEPVAHIAARTSRTRTGGGTTTGGISAPASTPVHCDLIASPSGSDSNGNGTLGSPYATLVKLDSALSPGQTGCLRTGTYGSTSTWQHLATDGTASGTITITAYPGEAPQVDGYVEIDASYTTLSHLTIDGSNTAYKTARAGITCPTPASDALSIAGSNDTLEYDDYYQSVSGTRGVGIGIGWWGNTDNTVIRFNKIHDTGQCDQYDHAIYLAAGNNVQIYDNWIWNNHGGQALSVYPGATNARIYSNVIDASDSGFTIGDNGSNATSGNEIYHNVVADSGTLSNPDHGWSTPGVFVNCDFNLASSSGNTVSNNDSFNNPGGTSNGCSSTTNVSISGASTANPQFVDAAAHNYAVAASSPVAGWGLWNGH
jgi:hypothetical protein